MESITFLIIELQVDLNVKITIVFQVSAAFSLQTPKNYLKSPYNLFGRQNNVVAQVQLLEGGM